MYTDRYIYMYTDILVYTILLDLDIISLKYVILCCKVKTISGVTRITEWGGRSIFSNLKS